MHSEQHRDGDEERAEHDLEQALVDPREPAGTDARTDDRPRGERDRRPVPHLARHAVGRDAGDADRDDRAERDRVRVTLGIGGPEHEQRHHDDAPADAQEPRQETAAEPDRDQLRVEPERVQACVHGAAHYRWPMSFSTRPELRGTFGMVASTHWLASAAGMAVLEQGGNAFDAAVAAGFTLQVVEPHLNGPGGDLPVLLWPAGGEPVVLAAQGPAPRAATVARYRNDFELELVPGTGPLAAVVPGSFGGWLAMLRDHGTLPLRDVLRFAIDYAENGYPMLPKI